MRKMVGIGLLVIAVFIAAGVYGYLRYRETQKLLAQNGIVGQGEVAAVLAKVGQLMELPTDEVPTLATVQDRTKLAKEPFFAVSQNGDKVIIYQNARKVILYRPSIDKVINVTVLTAPTVAPLAAVSSAPTASTYTVVVTNGTTVAGLASTIEKKLTAQFPNLKVLKLGNAASHDYKSTVVVDVSGRHAPESKSIAAFLGGKVDTFPSGEATPAADLLIIAGH
jgi:hypothetical protein